MNPVPTRGIAAALGAAYLAVGLIGFALTGFDDPTTAQGHALLILHVNPLHNVVHAATGGLLLAGGAAPNLIHRLVLVVGGALFAAFGTVGFGVAGTSADVFALNHADNVLHLVTGLVLLTAGVLATRQREHQEVRW